MLGTTLLDQQLWCLGRDIVRSEGNLLIQYGLNKSSPPAGERGRSSYHELSGGTSLVLWGWGVFVGAEVLGGLILKRYAFQPLFAHSYRPPLHVWHWDDLQGYERPAGSDDEVRAAQLMQRFADWVIGYETWVQREFGVSYRAASLAGWRRKGIEPESMLGSWNVLRQGLRI